MRVELEFCGWFQCRLATDPDPSDEPRGVSGMTFALPGEPDLDRIIRFQEPSHLRDGGPFDEATFGVFVDGVQPSEEVPPHLDFSRFEGAALRLSDDARFEGQDGTLGRSGEAIDPFCLTLTTPDQALSVTRSALWDPAQPGLSIYDTTTAQLDHRRPVRVTTLPQTLFRCLSFQTYRYWPRRREMLEAQLARTDLTDQQRLAYQLRLDALRPKETWRFDHLERFLAAWAEYDFALNGETTLRAPDEPMAQWLDTTTPWQIRFGMGAWDPDRLCGAMMGQLIIPLAPPPVTPTGAHGG